MTMVEHTILMTGRAVRGRGASPSAAGGVLSVIGNSLHGAVDMAFRGASGAGRRQKWLRAAGNAEFVDAEKTGDEEMTLYFESPPFGEVAEEYFSQPKLWDDGPREDDTAFDVLADAIGDVLAEKADSERFDIGLLRRFQQYESKVFKHHVEGLAIAGHRIPKGRPCRVESVFPQRARDLYQQTPEPQRARIAGKLDLIQASTLAFQLLLPSGERVRGVWRHDFETLRELVDRDVVASGMAIYRPSGTLLRIDADAMGLQGSADTFFASVPTPTSGKLELKSLVREQRKRGGVSAMWGQLPAEESDEEFLAAVVEMD